MYNDDISIYMIVSAMKDELESIANKKTWNPVELPKEKEMIGTKQVFQVKKHANGTIDQYKAPIVAKAMVNKRYRLQ